MADRAAKASLQNITTPPGFGALTPLPQGFWLAAHIVPRDRIPAFAGMTESARPQLPSQKA
jgi:hypothetical protein